MFKKFAAAASVFLLAFLVATGCPLETTPVRPDKKSADATTGGTAPSDKPAGGAAIAEPAKKPAEKEKAPDRVAIEEKKPPSAAGEHGADPGESVPKRDDPLFKSWPKPGTLIVATGMQMGYIEPCGCSGKENQLGGLSRRQSFLNKLVADGWTVVPLDVGGQVRRFGIQAKIKFERTADALKAMRYRAVAFGTDDLRLPAESLTAAATDVSGSPSPFVSANTALFGFDFDPPITPRIRIIEAGKLKLGVTAIIGGSAQRGINNDDIKFKPAEESLKQVLPELQKAHCDHLILLAHATLEESEALARKFPEFDFVITSGGAPEPPREPRIIEGTKTRLIEIGQKGEYAYVIGLFDDPGRPSRFRMVPLELRLGESEAMQQLMASYQDQLKQLDLSGLGVTPTGHPSGRQFVGSKVCGDCHTKAYDVWSKTPHAKALDTLANLPVPRQYDPECLSCHVTGWEPQKFYPYQGGYTSLDKTPLLAQNGCENCHGPGSAHVAAESGDKVGEKQRADLRASMRVAKSAETCIQCHDLDNSLKFVFETYWPKVEHKGKD